MRILLWTALYKPMIGGVERYVQRLATGLARLGCITEVVTNSIASAPDTETVDGLTVTRLPFPASRRGDMDAFRTVRDGLRVVTERLQPELVNLHTSGPSIVHYQLHRRALQLPLVTTFHGIYPHGPEMLSLVGPHLAAGIAASAATKASLVAIAGGVAAELDVRLPSLDDERRPPGPADGATALILGVGRLVTEKGWATLIEAMPTVLAVAPHARLIFVGDGDDRPRLEGLVAARELGSVVSFTGIVDDDTLTDLLDNCNVACMPTTGEEGFGMVAIEASSRARPVVASRSGGLVEAVLDGVTGILVPIADPTALAAALVNVLANPHLAAELGRRGREHASTFTPDALASATLDSFERALRRSRV